ncbi:T9SS type A sorting domain-containing protein [Lutimonas zeaxanthinifaciens]|uniref:T9SS type A sorting domain-containing protein n=1 Tax=Lutimonas zeaxanthinifaciens TaxID=3060215 RepID=UPI00265D150F|nr:T9SS type A sorting domain-containing protein [Lutimonas sp. YSD2104]WKK67540.1 T9SS type A sorting domain-containing protein [Lutimonas sp. YSD2104]
MKNSYLFSLVLCFGLMFGLRAQSTYVPDDNFEVALINLGYDDVPDDYVLTENISGLRELNLDNQSISDLTGIEDFRALESLTLQDNQITSIDLSGNSQLREVWVNFNNLTSLDLSSNKSLINVMAHANKLTELITDGADALEFLECSENQLTSLDLSKNTNLKGLHIGMNPLTEIDLSNLIELHTLTMSDTDITSLDCSLNKNLEDLYCYNNKLIKLHVKGADKLEKLDCSENNITELDLSENLLLKELSCHSNQITWLDLSGLSKLTHAWTDNNQFISLKTDGAIGLEQIDCSFNKIEDLDFSTNVSLNFFNCSDNALKSLNVKNGNNENIFEMDARNNPLLTCIQVDDPVYAIANWINIDGNTTFAADCFYALSVADEELNSGLQFYPNPTSHSLTIESSVNLNSVEIYSYLGERLLEIKNPKESIDLSSLNHGLYLVRFIGEEAVSVRRVVKN